MNAWKSKSMTLAVLVSSAAQSAIAAPYAVKSKCGYSGHWYWQPKNVAASYSGTIGTSGQVTAQAYTELGQGNFITVESTDYGRSTKYVWSSLQQTLSVTTQSLGAEATTLTVESSSPAYRENLVKMRNLIGYAGAPEAALLPDNSQTIYWDAIFAVTTLDEELLKLNAFAANCIVYDAATVEESVGSCELSAGPNPRLGSLEGRVKSVWVRDGFKLALTNDILSTSTSKDLYTSSSEGANRPDAERSGDGHFFVLKDETSLKAGSAVCQPMNP